MQKRATKILSASVCFAAEFLLYNIYREGGAGDFGILISFIQLRYVRDLDQPAPRSGHDDCLLLIAGTIR
jgi:hypothetical protein